jgi:hypothetical protein
MLARDRKAVKIVNCDLNIDATPLIRSARLIHVDGKGALTTSSYIAGNAKGTFDYLTQITLNGTPLIQINSPEYSTFKRILSAGLGIANADCQELNDLQERMNQPFVSLEDSIKTMEPFVELLDSGLYVIADALCYPTDGDGHFFWDIPDDRMESPAMEPVLLTDRVHPFIWGQPAFLYPTEDTDCYNEARVRYYSEVLEDLENAPRALVYNFGQFLSFLLDGHHKACAAALLRKPLKCLVILPFSRYGYISRSNRTCRDALCFGFLTIPADAVPAEYLPAGKHTESVPYSALSGAIRPRVWEDRYVKAACVFPTVYEYADMAAAGIPEGVSVTDDLIQNCLENPDFENRQILKAILFKMELQEDPGLKALAIACARQLPSGNLLQQAYRALAKIRNDREVEQVFVDCLTDHEDIHDPLLKIINSYWE